ncbi:MFS transporter [Pseudochryseolinea flava]|uniref:MFS transporter n=1 Tax=Pseudochryseolinea flava TaxID=2059302 RepID=A0A364Y0D8_9BACT|nr:MFS transporter [Pseudochryseolinea flava]RAW00051.1 MFS transporter [Pseudochryseolinea flava]
MKDLNEKIGTYRWTICGLVFFATTVNYLDRTVISFLREYLAKDFGWTSVEEVANYADIEMAFKLSYALGFIFAGRIIDKLGTKIGYALATTVWSIAAIAHAFVTTTLGFSVARIFLGVAEAGNFPAAIKTTAEWFPKKERALATGIFNSGSNVGAILVPFTIPYLAENYGWQAAFIITGAIGFVWLILWFMLYEVPVRQKRLSAAELQYINSDPVDAAEVNGAATQKLSWAKLLTYRQTWAFALGKFLTDPIWWFYIFWLPDFLKKEYNLTKYEIIWPAAIPLIIASFGSIAGGWLPMKFMNSGWEDFRARKTSMLLYAFIVVPVLGVQYLGGINMWFAVVIIGLAMAAHQAWSANIFTTVSDMFPKHATASVTGIGGLFGGLGGLLLTALVQKRMFVYYESLGKIQTGYFVMFLICGSAYLLGWIVMHLLAPRMEKIKV